MHLQMLTCLQDLQVRNIWLLTPLLPLQVHASSRLHCHIQLEIVQYLRFLHSVQLQLIILHHLYFTLAYLVHAFTKSLLFVEIPGVNSTNIGKGIHGLCPPGTHNPGRFQITVIESGPRRRVMSVSPDCDLEQILSV